MITKEKAVKYCVKEKCGHCMSHDAPFTCCNYMMNIFVKENGIEWCKNNIKYFEDYKPIPDDENILLTKKKKEKYEYTLLDFMN